MIFMRAVNYKQDDKSTNILVNKKTQKNGRTNSAKKNSKERGTGRKL